MTTFSSVSAPSYDASSLASKLTEKAADGWTVVAIVPTGSEVTAFLSREGEAPSAESSTSDTTSAPVSSAPSSDPSGSISMPATEAAKPAEPAGWGTAPESSSPSSSSTPTFEPAPSYQPAATPSPAVTPNPAPTPAPAPAAAPAPVSSVPAGWYSDPSGRFELRYWDGGQWSEHVSRGGQQFTDAPTA